MTTTAILARRSGCCRSIGDSDAGFESCASFRQRHLDEGPWADSCDRVAAHRLQARSASCSQLLAAVRVALRDMPLRSARADAVRQKIQGGRLHVYNKARDDRREKG